MRRRFIETPAQYSNEEFDMNIENPMLIAIVRIIHFRKILYSILYFAEHTFSPLLILATLLPLTSQLSINLN